MTPKDYETDRENRRVSVQRNIAAPDSSGALTTRTYSGKQTDRDLVLQQLKDYQKASDAAQKALENWAESIKTTGQTGLGSSGSNPGGGPSIPLSGSLMVATVPSPTPTAPPPTITPAKVVVPVKTAPIDTLVIDQDAINIDFMQDLIFEDIGGQELINIVRNDTVNGQTLSYKPIKNLTTIQQQYNPNNIVSLQDTSDKYFLNFPIKLESKLLEEEGGSGPDGAYVYIEEGTGDLIIELVNLEPDEQLEVQISVSGTIYEAEFNES